MEEFYMGKKVKKFLIFGILLILSISVRVYFGMQKEDLFMDETISYTLMNSENSMIHQKSNIENHWFNGEEITKELTIQKDEIFNYWQVYYNQTTDCHPPIYYFLLHSIATLFIDRFTIWTGLLLNILIWIGTFIFLYLIKKILKI